MAHSQTCRGLPQIWVWPTSWLMPLMKGREHACEMHGGTKPKRHASAQEERSRIQTDHDLKCNYLKEPRRKSREASSTSCPQEGHLQSTGTRGAGLWSGGQAKGPQRASDESNISHQSCGMCWLKGVHRRHMNLPRHWGHNPQPSHLGGLRAAALIPVSGVPIQDQGPFLLPDQGMSHDQHNLFFGHCWISRSSSGFGTKPACAEEDTTCPWHGFWSGQCSAAWLAEGCAHTMSI